MANVWVDDNTLKEIADSIRAKAGTEALMLPSEMKPVIDAIVTNPPLQEKSVTANGEVTADEGYYGLSKVTVNVPTSGGGSGGSGGSTIVGPDINVFENGYTVNFYNVDNVLFETHACLYDFWIDKPLSYPVHHWQNADGYMNQFPLTVSEEDTEKVFDLYPVVIGENACYLINPNGTDFDTTFLQADGTAQSGYTDKKRNGGFFPNYTENAYRLKQAAEAGSTKLAVHTFNDAIKCTDYKFLKVKWLYFSVWYAGSDSGGFQLDLRSSLDGGVNENVLKRTQINNKYNNYNLAYYQSIAGDSNLTKEDILNDVTNPAWRWTVIDISDYDEFYLTILSNYGVYIAEIIMC